MDVNRAVIVKYYIITHKLPLIPTDGAPAATAAKAYSICTNFPDGLRVNTQ